MSLPSLPTDNLYKFIFIGGLTLTISILIILATQSNSLLMEIDAANLQLTEAKGYDEQLKTEINELNRSIDTLEKKRSKFSKDSINSYEQYIKMVLDAQKDKNYRDYLDFANRNQAFLIPYYAETEELNKKLNEIKEKKRESILKTATMVGRAELIKSHYSQLVWLLICSLIFLWVGCSMIYHGCKLWYSKLQFYLDEKVKLEYELLEHQLAQLKKSKEDLTKSVEKSE